MWIILILQRFPNRNLSALSRDELLKLYSIYATPKARRNTPNTDVEMTPVNSNVMQENGHKRSRYQMISAPTVETVTNACKKIRLINTAATKKRSSLVLHEQALVVRRDDLNITNLLILCETYRKVMLMCTHLIQHKPNERKSHGPKHSIELIALYFNQ